MLISKARKGSGTRFVWGLPVYAVGCPGRPSGWVWGESVAYEAWDCWGAGGYNYRRLPLGKLDAFGYRQTPEWRQPRIPGP